jgi:hypothetical protein
MKCAETGIQNANNDSNMQLDLLQPAVTSKQTQPLPKPVPIQKPEAPPPSPSPETQPQSLPSPPSCTQVVHYFDKNGALRSGRFVQWIEEGEDEGKVLVSDYEGNQIIPDRIRNIE